jgi:hypothetical protein
MNNNHGSNELNAKGLPLAGPCLLWAGCTSVRPSYSYHSRIDYHYTNRLDIHIGD